MVKLKNLQIYKIPPYNEKYTEEELEEIFEEYQEKGYIYGVYNNEECIRINSIRKRSKSGSTS